MRNKALFLLSLILLSCNSYAQEAYDRSKAIENYAEFCSVCHGVNMEGGFAESLIDSKWKNGGSEKEIADSITGGLHGDAMPEWRDILSDEEVRSLVKLIIERQPLAKAKGAPYGQEEDANSGQ